MPWCVLLASLATADPLADAEARGRLAVEPEPPTHVGSLVVAGGTVMTADGAIHRPGYVVITDGTIAAVGQGPAPEISGAAVIDAAGQWVTPGLIDTHSHLGVYPSPGANAHGDGNEATAPTTPGVWAEHSVWPQDPGFARAIAGGITALQILPGSANLVGGRGFVAEVVPARGSRGMAFPGAPETVKMACGENPKRVYGEHRNSAPSTRMGNLRGQRQAFLDAEAYRRKWEEYARKVEEPAEDPPKKKKKQGGSDGDDAPMPPDRDLDLETLVGVLDGEILPQIHCYRADDMLAMLQVAREFDFRVRSFHHALEAYKIRDVLAAEGVASSTWADWWGFKLEAWDGVPENAAMLTEAGATAIIHSDSAIGIQRLNQEAAKAMASGRRAGIAVTEDQALRWITANPAWALGIDALTGTLTPGKRADLVVWDADPFSVYARARLVFVAGELRWDAARPAVWSDYELGLEVAP